MDAYELESLPRQVREEMFKLACAEIFKQRQRSKTATYKPNAKWIEDYNGRPREFIGEIMGQEWYDPDWTAWRAFVAAVFNEPLNDEELAIFKRCTGLEEPPIGFQSEVWVPVGRRGGKSRIFALIAVYIALCCDWRGYLAPGELGHIVVLAATREQAAAIMGYVKGLLGDSRLRDFVVRPLDKSIEVVGRVVIEVVTASIRAVRSRTVLCALCDEIAFWESDETSANPDTEILNALRPSMATIPEARLFAASSPYARRGALWDVYHRYYGQTGGPLVWKADTRTMHPSVPQAYIDSKYEEDPVAAAAEFGAEFRTDVGAFVPREVVEACVVPGRVMLAPVLTLGPRYFGFCDPSGGRSDSMTLAIAHYDIKTDRIVLDCAREWMVPFGLKEAAAEAAAILKAYKLYTVTGDHYAGNWPAEEFQKHGITYETSEMTKIDIYREALPLLTTGRAELLDDKRLVTQICSLERRTARGGRDSIDHPPGGHDDLANSALGAMVNLAGGPGIVISNEMLTNLAAAGWGAQR